MRPDPITLDTAARACTAAIGIALVEAQRAGWPDVVEQLYTLDDTVQARMRRADDDAAEAQLPPADKEPA